MMKFRANLSVGVYTHAKEMISCGVARWLDTHTRMMSYILAQRIAFGACKHTGMMKNFGLASHEVLSSPCLFTSTLKTSKAAKTSLFPKRNFSARFFSQNRQFVEDEAAEASEDAMKFDVLLVGAGPAGLSAAIKIKQLANQHGKDVSVCVIEKGAEVGSHILSGNIFEPRALAELFPDYESKIGQEDGPPLDTKVQENKFFVLSEKKAFQIPEILLPSAMKNAGNFVISLGSLCKWLAKEAEELGVEIYPGFAAERAMFNAEGAVVGVKLADVGIDKKGNKKSNYEEGMRLFAKQTLVGEGCYGSVAESLIDRYDLRRNACPQQYALGIKEVWEVPDKNHREGLVYHTVGWPFPNNLYAGSFVYHMKGNLVLVGAAIGLDYKNPYMSMYEEFQRLKKHPMIKADLSGGTCVSYGARCLNEGGIQCLPRLTFPGGMLIGCSAGFLNTPKIKGSHTAMKSGITAGEAVYEYLNGQETEAAELTSYEKKLRKSWLWDELQKVRNVRPAFKLGGLYSGLLLGGISMKLFRGREPWTLTYNTHEADTTELATAHKPINYEKPDGVLSFSILDNLARSGTNHEHDQPAHLKVKSGMENVPVDFSLRLYAAPETRFCPAKVYEIVEVEDEKGEMQQKLQINAQNCLHCKCCAIKTPKNYIKWNVPEGGGGPNYKLM